MKIDFKVIVVGLLILLCLLMTYYFHFVIKTQIVFTHLFYIPIVIASIYWKRAGITISIFLGGYLIISQIISSIEVTPSDLIRSIMFVTIAFVITTIMNKNKNFIIRLKQTEEYIAINKELKESNELLQKAKKQVEESVSQLRELNATKDKLFTIMAHDLKSPFNSVLGFSDLLIKEFRNYDDEKIENFLAIINSTSKHTLVLLDNLLDWVRLQTKQIIYQPENLPLQPIILEILELLSSSAKIKNISLNAFQSDGIVVYADRNMLQTIIRNLISNAIKFTNTGGEIDIYVVANHSEVEITISDNGVGMNEETRNKLFNVNTSITTLGTAKERGSGLGLIICKEFVEKQGGEIWVVSESGKGSDFKFTLPLS